LILRRAFYELARKDVAADAADVVDVDDDTEGISVDGDNEDDPEGENDGKEEEDSLEKLDFDDVVKLIRGQKHLMAAWTSALDLDPYKTCKVLCKAARSHSSFFSTLTKNGKTFAQAYQFDPVCGIEKLIATNWKKQGYCEGCENLRKTELKIQKRRLWIKMDEWFVL
jgi:hypothetical protein